MELTAKTLQEVTFGSSKVRGYNPAEVDQFIEAVAEGVEELRERLRRAVERATRAEQALASAPQAAAVAEAPPVAAPAAQPEISKVWERAVAAAEQAVSEAKAEAEAMVSEARQQAEARTSSANIEADTRLTAARQEAESLVANAIAEATRISDESQAQLRADLAHLENARGVLQSDVEGLSGFLLGEKQRLFGQMHQALTALEHYGTNLDDIPPANTPYVPPEPAPAAASSVYEPPAPAYEPPAETDVYESESEYESESDSAPVSEGNWQAPAAPLDVPQFSSESVAADNEEQAWAQSEWTAPADEPPVNEPEAAAEPERDVWAAAETAWGDPMPGEPEPPQIAWSDDDAEPARQGGGTAPDAGADEDGDPFLAELRKAVQDDGPLGPREEAAESDTSIESLYSTTEEEDRSGFFRRKK